MFVFNHISSILSKLDPVRLMSRVFSNEEIKNALIDAITLRLQNKGETASGKKLKTDSAIKQGLGKVYSVFNYEKANRAFVDLFDDGDFYDSFKITVPANGFEVSANFNKEEGNIFDNFNESFGSSDLFYEEILKPIRDEFFTEFVLEDVKEAFFDAVIEFIKFYIKN